MRDKEGRVRQRWVRNAKEAVDAAKPFRSTADIWFGPGLRRGEQGDAAHVTRLKTIWSDVDAKCFAGSHDEAWEALHALPLRPSVVVATGHGFHGYWALQDAIDANDQGGIARRTMAGIQNALSSLATKRLDSVHDLARVLRLPNTSNLKGRQPLSVRVVEFEPSRVYDLSEFEANGLTADFTASSRSTGDTQEAAKIDVGRAEAALLRALGAGLKPWAVGALEDPEGHKRESNSQLDHAVLCELLKYVDAEDAELIWRANPLGARDKVRLRPDYVQRTIARALASVGTAAQRPPGAASLTLRSAAEIETMAPPQTEWVVEGIVARSAITLLTGKPKASGKTTFALAMVRSVIDGVDFITRRTVKSPVVYLTEERTTTFQEGLTRARLDGSPDLHVAAWGENSALSWSDVVRDAVAECHRVGASVLIVDTLPQWSHLRGDAENNAGDALEALRPLQEAANSGIGVIVVVHDRKSGGEASDSARGSSAFVGGVDVVLSLRRCDGGRRLREVRGIGRFDAIPDKITIELRDDGYHEVNSGSAQTPLPSAADAVLAFLPSREEDAITIEDLEPVMFIARTALYNLLKKLVAAGAVRRTGSGRKGKPYRYWVVPEDA